MDLKRLYLLDAYALIFRAYYALIKVPRLTSEGFNTSTVFGFVNTLEELLRKEKPTHIAVCFDPQGPTFRHEAFEQYKGERDATPEDIKLSVPIIKDIVRAYNIPVLEVDGFEADDLIGTMAKMAEKEGMDVYMMTPDKDFGQLVSDHIYQYKPAYRGQDFEVRGVRDVCERYGIERPIQVIDILALMGDKVDNIPGCPGVGEKTAMKLVGEFGTVEELISRAGELKGSLHKKVTENADQIRFSKFLATIRTDVPVDVAPADLERKPENTDELFGLFSRLEFRTLSDRVKKRMASEKGDERGASVSLQPSLFDELPADSLPTEVASYKVHIVNEEGSLSELENQIAATGQCAVFTLAQGEADMTARRVATAIAASEGDVYYLPVRYDFNRRYVARLMRRPEIKIISNAIKRDYVISGNESVGEGRELLLADYYDVTVAHYLLQPEQRHGLEYLSETCLGITVEPYESIAGGKGVRQTPMLMIAEDRLSQWGCAMAMAIWRLYPVLDERIDAEGQRGLLNDVELPLIRVLAEMELTGVRIDVAALNEAASMMSSRIAGIEREIYDMAGEEFNVGSPAKVGEILFDKLQLDPKAKKTKTGQYSTGEEVLEKIAHLNPIVHKILEFRQLKKLLNTYLLALPQTINPATGKIHTTYNQTVTATGRISSSDPNLQNIPVRDDIGREIRRAFIPDEGHVFLSVDYSQIELRLVADFADDEVMLEAFREGKDIHAITASRIYKEPLESVTADQRRAAKTANFGILYGISAFGLASRLGIPRKDAKQLIDGYFETFPTIHRYMENSIDQARKEGFVTTICGRRRMLPDINSRNPVVRGYAERNAINAPVQGSAADIIKIAMVRIFQEMRRRGLRSKMIMQVHDELNFDVLPEELDEMRELVVSYMEGAYSGRVRLTASCGEGPDWLTAH